MTSLFHYVSNSKVSPSTLSSSFAACLRQTHVYTHSTQCKVDPKGRDHIIAPRYNVTILPKLLHLAHPRSLDQSIKAPKHRNQPAKFHKGDPTSFVLSMRVRLRNKRLVHVDNSCPFPWRLTWELRVISPQTADTYIVYPPCDKKKKSR
jgi:hypothetical protein